MKKSTPPSSLDTRIARLEKNMSLPGTSLTRTLLDLSLCKKLGLNLPKVRRGCTRGCHLVWTLGLGNLQTQTPKTFFYGKTIEEVVTKAENFVKDHPRVTNPF